MCCFFLWKPNPISLAFVPLRHKGPGFPLELVRLLGPGPFPKDHCIHSFAGEVSSWARIYLGLNKWGLKATITAAWLHTESFSLPEKYLPSARPAQTMCRKIKFCSLQKHNFISALCLHRNIQLQIQWREIFLPSPFLIEVWKEQGLLHSEVSTLWIMYHIVKLTQKNHEIIFKLYFQPRGTCFQTSLWVFIAFHSLMTLTSTLLYSSNIIITLSCIICDLKCQGLLQKWLHIGGNRDHTWQPPCKW